ncbi:MAG: hypothetical protein M3319_09945 [Actinomycetota bacterium]|nr:hypothetical protein [Actinomycetota bacterium]
MRGSRKARVGVSRKAQVRVSRKAWVRVSRKIRHPRWRSSVPLVLLVAS